MKITTNLKENRKSFSELGINRLFVWAGDMAAMEVCIKTGPATYVPLKHFFSTTFQHTYVTNHHMFISVFEGTVSEIKVDF